MFVVLFILPESPSVVISPGLAALGKAGDHLVIAQDIVWDLRDEGHAILQDDLQLQSSLTPTSAHPATGHVICLGQSEASIPANQKPDTIKYVTGKRQEELTDKNCSVLRREFYWSLI